METKADIRSPNEASAEFSLAVGMIALTLLLYFGCVALRLPDGPAQFVSTGAASLLLLVIRRRIVRQRPADRELREAIAGGPVVNPILVCVAIMTLILFVESFFGFVFGALFDMTVAVTSSDPATISDVIMVVPPFTLAFTVILTWPIIQLASHYLANRAVLWIVGAVILSRILRLIIISSFITLPWGWGLVLDQAVSGVLLVLAGLLGHRLARKRNRTFLLSRAFRKLSHADQEAVLELIVDRRHPSSTQGAAG